MQTNTRSAILVTIWSVFQAGKKNYTTISVDRLLYLLNKFHNVKIKRRWAFYCIRDLLDSGIIARRSRFKQGDKNDIHQLSSMLTFTLIGLKYLVRNRISGAYAALKKMLSWLKNKDNRFPQPENLLPGLSPDDRRDNIKKLKLLIKGIGNVR